MTIDGNKGNIRFSISNLQENISFGFVVDPNDKERSILDVGLTQEEIERMVFELCNIRNSYLREYNFRESHKMKND